MKKGKIGRRLLSYYTNLPLCKPEMINLGLTHRCGLDCSICNTKEDDPDLEKELSREELKDVIKEIGEWGDIGVSFAGGEPLIRKDDLLESVKTAKKQDLTTYMTTNGRGLDKKTSEQLVEAGLDFISLSLDGAEKSTNDYIRDEDSYNAVMDAIENLKKAKEETDAEIKIGLTTVVTDKNLEELIEIHRLVQEKELHEVNYNPYVPDNSFMGQVDYEDDEFWIRGDRLEKLEGVTEKLITIKNSEEGKIGTSDFILNSMVEYFRKKGKFRKGKCLAGQSYMYIKPNGEVDVCGKGPSFESREMNVKDRDIKDIWRSFNFFITRLKIKNCKRPCLMLCFPKINVKNLFR
ncbi:MAG: radical SAM/SPASM domain-containing protein [Candidatus Aenigmatarchaeota archaeon]